MAKHKAKDLKTKTTDELKDQLKILQGLAVYLVIKIMPVHG